MEWLNTLLHNTWFVGCAMAVLIFGITELIKLPLKKGIKKLIKNERIRKIVNTIFLLIPFALGIVFELVFKTYYLHTEFNGVTGLHYGTAAVTLYGVVERFFYEKGVKIENPYNTEEGKAVTQAVEDITKDGKVDETDIKTVEKLFENTTETEKADTEKTPTAVDDFLNKVK